MSLPLLVSLPLWICAAVWSWVRCLVGVMTAALLVLLLLLLLVLYVRCVLDMCVDISSRVE